jgi:hypothetical protein
MQAKVLCSRLAPNLCERTHIYVSKPLSSGLPRPTAEIARLPPVFAKRNQYDRDPLIPANENTNSGHGQRHLIFWPH